MEPPNGDNGKGFHTSGATLSIGTLQPDQPGRAHLEWSWTPSGWGSSGILQAQNTEHQQALTNQDVSSWRGSHNLLTVQPQTGNFVPLSLSSYPSDGKGDHRTRGTVPSSTSETPWRVSCKVSQFRGSRDLELGMQRGSNRKAKRSWGGHWNFPRMWSGG